MKKNFKWANSKSATILTLMSVAVLVITFSALSFFEGKKKGIIETKAAFEWVEDCWNTSHKNAPKNGTARIEGNSSR